MKNKTLKHYKRKKFFYRFFMRNSPRTGMMFGLAWMTVWLIVAPFFVFGLLPFWDIEHDCESCFLGAMVCGSAAAVLFLFYGFWVYCCNLYTVLRNNFVKSRWMKLLAFVSVCSYIGDIFLILAILLKKKKWIFAIFALAAVILSDFSIVYLSCLLLLAALAGIDDGKKFNWRFMWCLGFGGISLVFVAVFCHAMQADIKNFKAQIVRNTGYSLEFEDYLKRNNSGLSLESEVLKKLSKDKIDDEYLKALDEFCKLPVSRIRWEIPHKNELISTLTPILPSFKMAVKHLQKKIIDNPADKKLVADANFKLTRLRDWMKNDELLLCHIAALAFESYRLDALKYVIGSGKYTELEIQQLTGDYTPWHKNLKFAVGNEVMVFESLYETIISASAKYEKANGIKANTLIFLAKDFPLFFKVNMLKDYHFAMRYYNKYSNFTGSDSAFGAEKFKMLELDQDEIIDEFHYMSKLMLAFLPKAIIRAEQLRNKYFMAKTAAEIMVFKQKNGKLPDSWQSENYIDIIHGEPFIYKKSADGFTLSYKPFPVDGLKDDNIFAVPVK